ncbi:hypothetical protein JNM87_00595 [Candidatus Saccharibacteria bacterium]|nr:hypothetical protein [Candidatus Saccharibacteria bacterium]
MTNEPKRQYDLAERTENFAANCRAHKKSNPKSVNNIEVSKQLVRSSGSVAANYLEADESLCRIYSRESKLCLKPTNAYSHRVQQSELIQVAFE